MHLLTGGEPPDEVVDWETTDVVVGFESAQNQPIFAINQ